VRRLLLGLLRKAFIVERVRKEADADALGVRHEEGDAIVALPFSWA
jgi:hypothetical protein